MSTYYKDLWTKPNNHGTIFWRDVDFNKNEYKLQEHIFRQLLKSIKRLNKEYVPSREISSVLEVGVGTGRMTKIVREELPDIKNYMAVDINDPVRWEGGTPYPMFARENIVELMRYWSQDNKTMIGGGYDLILASEIFMHIKPEDIEHTIKGLVNCLAPKGLIINIDWFFEPNALSEWCFIHDYHKMYEENGLTPLFTADMREIKQKMFCYQK